MERGIKLNTLDSSLVYTQNKLAGSVTFGYTSWAKLTTNLISLAVLESNSKSSWPSLRWWVTVVEKVGDPPNDGGQPSLCWWVTKFWMVVHHTGDGGWPSWGCMVTILWKMGDHLRHGHQNKPKNDRDASDLSSLKNFVSSPGKEWWRRTRWGGRRCQWWQGWCSWSHSQSRSPASLPLTGTLPLDREKLLSAQTPPVIETDYD